MRRLFAFEKKQEPVASPRVFYNRLARNGILALLTVVVSLALGTGGYAYFEQMPLIDAFANAAMILSGMGPLNPLFTVGGKLFASFYAVASGLLLFVIAGLMLAPVYHRILHRFHVDDQDAPPPPAAKKRKR
jgi:hypothetical protein